MDVFDRIREEHRTILAIMDDLVGRDPESRRDEMNTLAMQIIAHMDAEERSIYKAFADADDILSDLGLVVLNGEVMAAKQIESADPVIRDFLNPQIDLRNPRFKKLEASYE